MQDGKIMVINASPRTKSHFIKQSILVEQLMQQLVDLKLELAIKNAHID